MRVAAIAAVVVAIVAAVFFVIDREEPLEHVTVVLTDSGFTGSRQERPVL